MEIRSILRHRAAHRTRRGARDDDHHLALVLEGGGMRGVVAGGIVCSLEERNLLSCFDSVHGSSAGECAAAYFAAGQARLGTRIYYEDINNSTFISIRRVLCGRPVMDVDYLTDVVMQHKKPLDVPALLAQPGFVNIVTTGLDDGRAHIFNTFRTSDHFFQVLKASSMVPIVAGLGVEVDGVPLIDGALTQHIAIDSALCAGATHILVGLCGRIGDAYPLAVSSRGFIERAVLRLALSEQIAELHERNGYRVNALLDRMATGWIGASRVEIIARRQTASAVGSLTIDGQLLRTADLEGRRAAEQYLSG